MKEAKQRLVAPRLTARGSCPCGQVKFEITVPAVWAWHDHSKASQKAHGAFCATYVGSWLSRFRLTQGEDAVRRWEEPDSRAIRSFCGHCGAPLFYQRARATKMINISRALFHDGTGREPRYHIAIDQTPEWAYQGGPLGPLKGFPGVVWERPRKKKLPISI